MDSEREKGKRIFCWSEFVSYAMQSSARCVVVKIVIALRGHGAAAASSVEVILLDGNGAPAIVLHALGCRR